jgi:mRNA interferase RelE/StbE
MIAYRYRLVVDPPAKRFLKKLRDKALYERLRKAIEQLLSNPYPPGCKKLQGQPGYRVRVGDYRIVYRIIDHELIVVVVDIGDRKDVYR